MPATPGAFPPAFYVYALTVAGVCRYVGKGTGSRAWDHFDNIAALLRAAVNGAPCAHDTPVYRLFVAALARDETIRVRIVAAGLTESEAHAREKDLIAEYGRAVLKEGAPLWNLADGGAGVGRGYAVARAAHRNGERTGSPGINGRARPGRESRRIRTNAFGAYGGANG